jgi:BlaI family transcriptional regulator, penicillinase repressor
MVKRDEPSTPPSEAQVEVLNIIWDRGQATVGEIWQAFSAQRPVARNTVLTLVTRLEEKGWLRRHEEGNVLRYSAVVPKQTALRQFARRLVETAFGGSTEGLIMALLGDGEMSEVEAQRIRAMLDKVRGERKGKGKS